MKAKDLTNKKFGRLTGIKRTKTDKHGYIFWLFKCSCGSFKEIRSSSVFNGYTRSCGCYFIEVVKSQYTHNRSKTPEYLAWIAMRARCINKFNKNYFRYGGRGIKVCKTWLNSFENFYKDMGDRPKGKTLERINNNKGYSKLNCKWATHKEQQNNLRSNVNITFNGITMNVSQWALKIGINCNTLRSRLYLGYSIERALNPKLYEGR